MLTVPAKKEYIPYEKKLLALSKLFPGTNLTDDQRVHFCAFIEGNFELDGSVSMCYTDTERSKSHKKRSLFARLCDMWKLDPGTNHVIITSSGRVRYSSNSNPPQLIDID